MASQSDYTQVTRGGGHGDYRTIVYAPYSVQELCDYMQLSFEKAQEYCNPVVLASDGNLAKLRESCELPDYVTPPDPETIPNALTGCKGRASRKVRTGLNGDAESRERNETLQAKFRLIEEKEARYEAYDVNDADIVLVVWGSFARVCLTAMEKAREEGIKVGMIRPITLWPFPQKAFESLTGKKFLVCELNAGQMVDDVKLAVENKRDVYLYHRFGCTLPSPKEILAAIHDLEVK